MKLQDYLFTVLQSLMLFLKLFGMVTWSWWIVFLPIIILLIVALFAYAVLGFLYISRHGSDLIIL